MKVIFFLARQSRNQRLGDFTTEDTEFGRGNYPREPETIRSLRPPCLCGASANFRTPGKLSNILIQRARNRQR